MANNNNQAPKCSRCGAQQVDMGVDFVCVTPGCSPFARKLLEHPDDKRVRERDEAAAAKIIDDFAREHHADLIALVQVYADAGAEKKLDELREKFWKMVVQVSGEER